MSVRSILLGYLGAARRCLRELGEARLLLLLEAAEMTDAVPMSTLFLAATRSLLGDRAAADQTLEHARRIAPPEHFRLPPVAVHRPQLANGLSG